MVILIVYKNDFDFYQAVGPFKDEVAAWDYAEIEYTNGTFSFDIYPLTDPGVV